MSGLELFKKDVKDILLPISLFFCFYFIMDFFWHRTCPMVIITGFPCPGCGLTRAGILLLKGEWMKAFIMHPFIYPIVIFMGFYVLLKYILKRSLLILNKGLVVLIILMCIFYIYRMIVFFPNVVPMSYYSGNILKSLWESINGL